MKLFLISIFLIISIFLSLLAEATLGPGDKKKKPPKTPPTPNPTTTTNNQPAAAETPKTSVIARHLVHKDLKHVDEILHNHAQPCVECATLKRFTGAVLGYVTPWNAHGYDVSKEFSNKIEMNAPVWLQIKRVARHKYELTGTHDIDRAWMEQVRVRKTNDDGVVRFVPRILFEKLRMEDVHALFSDEGEKEALAKMLVSKASEFGFDGYVLEIYMQLGGQGKTEVNHLVQDLCEALHAQGKWLILVVPPPIKNLIEGSLYNYFFL
jgi:chitinase domain-containing protein 1